MTDNSPATSFGSQGATHAGDGATPARAREDSGFDELDEWMVAYPAADAPQSAS